jgi:protein kinase A
MPNLGFLKKKRTKDSSGSRDLNSPTSPVKDTPPSSKEGPTASDLKDASPNDSLAQAKPDGQMTSVQSPPVASPHNQQNVPSIQNLLNNGTDANKAVNGGAVNSSVRSTKGKYALQDFTMQRTLGTGSFGRVHLVQSKHNQRFYAIKVLKKAQVVKMKQVEHTNDERRMLSKVKHPFLITLWGTFQDSKNLYMVMDFVEGGELFSLLRKSQVGKLLCIGT